MIGEPEQYDWTPVPWSPEIGVVARSLVRFGTFDDPWRTARQNFLWAFSSVVDALDKH